jgi:nitronate monooxygenase
MMSAVVDLRDLCRRPVVVAPMAGGPSTPGLVVAAAAAGGLGFLAAGYKTAEAMAEEIKAVRAATAGAFGVNVFLPQPPADPAAVRTYVASLQPEAEALGVPLGEPAWDDDGWEAKLAVLLADPPPLVSFTFGCPPADVLAAFRHAGTLTMATVTTPEEAELAAVAGAGCLCVQGTEAGAHRGSFTNDHRPGQDWTLLGLLAEVPRVTDLPLVAAGAVAGPEAVAAVRVAGALAASAGTAFLRCPESGTHPVHRAALIDAAFSATAVTRAFSGRRARGLVNRFLLAHPDAPAAYPEINNATRPLRAAAAAQGDAGGLSLWAGQAWRAATDRPAGEILDRLAGHAAF